MLRLELKSSRSFLAIKRCQGTKSKKVIKLRSYWLPWRPTKKQASRWACLCWAISTRLSVLSLAPRLSALGSQHWALSMIPGSQRQALTARLSLLSRGCTGEFWNKNISLKMFFCELNVVGIMCWTNSCQKKLKKSSNPSVTVQNMLISFRCPN